MGVETRTGDVMLSIRVEDGGYGTGSLPTPKMPARSTEGSRASPERVKGGNLFDIVGGRSAATRRPA
jgi:hypothetical protein